MPTGVVQWFDPRTGEGRVMDRGRRYAVRQESMEAKARHPGARVHFDIDHDADGDVAIHVELREGTRVTPRQRRFGDLVGARARHTKIETGRVDEGAVRAAATHPVRVAEAWAGHVAAGDSGAAARLYSPTATHHSEGMVTIGPKQIRRSIEDHPRFGTGLEPDAVEGVGDAVRVRWEPQEGEPGADTIESHLAIEHGEIVEQWTGETRTVLDTASDVGPIEVSAEGAVSTADRGHAVEALRRSLAGHGDAVHHVNVRLEWLADPAQRPRARARATVDLDGDLVRAAVRGATVEAAVDQLVDRLAERLRRRADHHRTLRRRSPTGDGEWRHGDAIRERFTAARPEASRRAVVRRPTWSAEPSTFDEAVFDLEALDLDFLLFVDLASGQDAVVYRRPRGTYAVRLAGDAEPGHRTASTAAVEFDPAPTPHLTIEQAREHLDEGGEEWVFFEDPASGRGNVLHRRDDGHDGLVTPRIEADALAPSH